MDFGLSTEISFGRSVRRPDQLETRRSGAVLAGIRDGDWRPQVDRVRALPDASPERRAAKTELPFCTWAGVFSRRQNSGLLRHSGQLGIDLDGLGESGAVAALQTAVADTFCLAAFRSVSGQGVRLLFRVTPCTADQHSTVFEQVSEHVRALYGVDPDASGRDVSRASFVSFDKGLWLNLQARTLPVRLGRLDTATYKRDSLCLEPSPYAGSLAVSCWGWWGRHVASSTPVSDGTARTHRSLLELGKCVALHAHRIREPLTPQILNAAFAAWWGEFRGKGIQLRGTADEYRREFAVSAAGCCRKPWFKPAANKWVRWGKHREFPRAGLPLERIEFAIRRHCEDARTDSFFIGVRDAAMVAGVGKDTAALLLRKLVAGGVIQKTGPRRHPRHAQTYRLLKP